MEKEYKGNHYVPEWYQRRFIPSSARIKSLYYLDTSPPLFIDSKGKKHFGKSPYHWGPRKCFKEDDLYTVNINDIESKEIEKIFFGKIDTAGSKAVEFFTGYDHKTIDDNAFENLLIYMSTQKLRTPKGLSWMKEKAGKSDKNFILNKMVELQRLYCAVWTESVWQIADADYSNTKFIISDHPVTVYNRRCGPKFYLCRGINDPDIWLNGTHTIFPLSLNKILILTNLSWVRNPYQDPLKKRPNPNPFRSAMIKYTNIQILRHLSEKEVREINFIIKKRALRYIAAGNEEWLFPENYVSKSNWCDFGDGYLLMPDPRSIHLGGEILIGHKDGTSTSFDEYGRRPWQPGYGTESDSLNEAATLHHFQGEFSRLYGKNVRGRKYHLEDLEPEVISDELYQNYLKYEKIKVSKYNYRK